MSNGPLVDRIVCLSELSKDLEGELRLVESERERCGPLRCITLETVHQLRLAVSSHDCDSRTGALLNGSLAIGDLVHKFLDGDGNNRGVHEATFRWRSQTLLATGTMRGVTNVGTHRAPAFDECQRCKDPGVMEGLLLGTIRRARDPRLLGCDLQAAYRLRFDPSQEGGSGGVRGTLEGAVICDCPTRPRRTCIDFSAMAPGAGPNPRTEQNVSFAISDPNGAPLPNSEIKVQGAFTGLEAGWRIDVKLPERCSSLEATLVTFASAGQLEAFNTDGSSAGTAVMSGTQNVAETLTVSGSSIESAVITAPQDETMLLRFCFTPLAG